MKIKITEAGFESYTGIFGTVDFLNGVSVSDVSQNELMLLSAIMRVESLDGTQQGSNAQYVESYDQRVTAEQVEALPAATEPVAKKPKYTHDELAKIADEKGIEGLREIGNEFGVKAQSIAKLIDLIKDAQFQEELKTAT